MKTKKEIKDLETDEEVEETDDEVEETEEDVEEETTDDVEKMVRNLFGSTKEETVVELKKYIDAELEKKRKKAGIYNKEVQEQEQRTEKNARFKKLMMAVGRGDFASAKSFIKTKDHSTAEPSEIVDSELSPEILHLQEEYGVARQLFRTLQLTKHSYKANELATDVVAYWVDEGDTITGSNITITQNELTLDKLAALCSFTNELLEDEEVDLVGFITQRVAEVFAKAEDDQFLADSTDGIIYKATDCVLRVGNTDMESVTGMDFGDKLLDLQEEVSKSVRDRAVYLMSFSVFNYIRKLRDEDERPLYKDLSGEGPKTIHGKSIVISDSMPGVSDCKVADKPILAFGDFERGCILGYKGGIRIDRATQGEIKPVGTAVNLFQTDRQAVRFIQRTGYTQVLDGTIAVLKTDTSS